MILFAAIRNKHQPLAAALSAKPEPEAPSAEVSGKKKKNQRKKNKCLNCKKPGFLIKTFCGREKSFVTGWESVYISDCYRLLSEVSGYWVRQRG